MYYKNNCFRTTSGTESIIFALKELKSKRVIVPTWTCSSLVRAIEAVGCEYLIVDSDFDLQIDVKEVIKYANDYDTVIIPHMCGIQADVKTIRQNTALKIIEDISQCNGFPKMGFYSDVVVCSTAKSKWLDLKKGGLLFSNEDHDLYPFAFHRIKNINEIFNRRRMIGAEIIEAGVDLIGPDSSFLRAMYFTKGKSDRKLYEPLHRIYEKGDCPKADDYSDNLNWISIFV